jgi:hypothetical protein
MYYIGKGISSDLMMDIKIEEKMKLIVLTEE